MENLKTISPFIEQISLPLQNISFLLCLIFAYDYFLTSNRFKNADYKYLNYKDQIITTIIISITIICIMIFPWHPLPGVNIDARSVLLSISGIFFGTIPTLILMTIAVITRYLLGGKAVYLGILLCIVSTLFSFGFKYYYRKIAVEKIPLRAFYWLGICTCLFLTIPFFMLAPDVALKYLKLVYLPALLVAPLATVLLAHLLQEKIIKKDRAMIELHNNALLEKNFNMKTVGLLISDASGKWLKVNTTCCNFFNYDEEEMLELSWADILDPKALEKELEQQQQLIDGVIDSYEGEKRYLTKNRSIFYSYSVNSSQRDSEGAVEFIITSFIDLTATYNAKIANTATEEQLNSALKASYISIFDVNLITTNIHVKNSITANLLNLKDEELNRERWLNAIHPSDRTKTYQTILKAIRTPFNHSVISYEYRLISANNETHWLLDQGSLSEFDYNGYATRYRGTTIDITHRKSIESNLKLAASVYNNSQDGMAVINRGGYIISINKAFTTITGLTEEETINRHLSTFQNDQISDEFIYEMVQSILYNHQWQGEFLQYKKNGESYTLWLSLNSIIDSDGSPSRYVALFFDITEQKRTEQLIWQQANYDALTNLPNRRLLLEYLNKEISKSNRSGLRFAVLFLDLDNFKEINDVYGHSSGDTVLLQTTKRLNSCIRDMDIIARFGGDEFTIVLSSIEDNSFIEMATKRIMEEIARPFKLINKSIYISASIGISIYPQDADNANDLIKHADQAMYEAKTGGRNRFCYFMERLQSDAQLRLNIIKGLRVAIKKKQFVLYYQPIIDLKTMKVTKAEALIRWNHPEKGLISPIEFIHLAEASNLIIEIGDWVFKEATNQIVKWRETYGVELQISINKSPLQFRDENFHIDEWLKHLKAINLSGDQVNIEITEGLLLDNNESIYEKLEKYRQNKITISLDDFGTGYSSLSYVQRFEIDYIKIDRHFVHDLEVNNDSLILCQAIIGLAHKLNLLVVAEGIETEAQRDILARNHCNYGQGYLFSKPLTAEAFSKKYFT